MNEELKVLAKKIDKLRRTLSGLPNLEERHEIHEIEEYQHLNLELEEALIVFKYLVENQSKIRVLRPANKTAEPKKEAPTQHEASQEIPTAHDIFMNVDEAISKLDSAIVQSEEELIEAGVPGIEELKDKAPLYAEKEGEDSEAVEETEEANSEVPEINEISNSKSTVGERLSKMPISDLKGAFGLNERFFYANELFGGNGEEFIRAINELNHLSSFSDAQRLIEAKYVGPNNWDLEKEEVMTFLEIVERRYL
ncbi:MAG: hypothetical protein KDC83_02655 [Flavobacteriales bacterium]|nr:hypothetical protein [Flavobacteriales bacterium]